MKLTTYFFLLLFFVTFSYNNLAEPIRYSLITTLYHEKNPQRIQEYLDCLEKNLAHELIDDIHIIYDFSKDDEQNELLKHLQKKNVILHYYHGRPSYGICFHLAHTLCKHTRIIVCNADIYFNETLAELENVDLNRIVLGLTRWDVTQNGSLELFKQYRANGEFWDYSSYSSQDAWIFQLPLPCIDNDTLLLGTMSCDSLIAYHIEKAGLKLFNPCESVQACHLHLSKVRNYEPRIAPGPKRVIPWCTIDSLPKCTNNHSTGNNFEYDYPLKNRYRVSLITSLYKGDQFIVDFMKNITQQSLFEQSELIIVNAHSPGNEEEVIMPYLKRFSNIHYIRLPADPGLYATWNLMIRYASSDLIANANVDDRRATYSLQKQVEALEANPRIDLAYCNYAVTEKPNDQWHNLAVYPYTREVDFSPKEIRLCRPGPMPTWRKSIHDRWGYFREDFISAADHELWCRIVNQGSQFMKVSGKSGLYYKNPEGISTDPKKNEIREKEHKFIRDTYRHLWAKK